MRALLLLSLLAACGGSSSPEPGGDDDQPPPADASGDGPVQPDGGAHVVDAGIPDATPAPDAFSGDFDISVFAHDDCTFTTVPDHLAVPAGTSFTVTWFLQPGSITTDIAKIDQFNQVPLIIGMEPGMTFHDSRMWCGEFTGTFQFRLTSCADPFYLPVDCSL